MAFVPVANNEVIVKTEHFAEEPTGEHETHTTAVKMESQSDNEDNDPDTHRFSMTQKIQRFIQL